MSAHESEIDIGIRIRTLRKRRRMSLRDLASNSGLSANAISRIERGESSPTVSTLRRLATSLEIPIMDLFADGSEGLAIHTPQGTGRTTHSAGITIEGLGSGGTG